MDSKQWLRRNSRDPLVGKAISEGYRSRAAYKLIALDSKLRVFDGAQRIVDLGCAPGSWSQVAAKQSPANATVYAIDLLPMKPIAGVDMIQGDFLDDQIRTRLASKFDGDKGGCVDLVLSDMAPNLSGIESVDQFASAELVAMAIDFSTEYLKPSGAMIAKIFHGSEFQQLLNLTKKHFVYTKIIKPESSRSKSKEAYLYAKMLAS